MVGKSCILNRNCYIYMKQYNNDKTEVLLDLQNNQQR